MSWIKRKIDFRAIIVGLILVLTLFGDFNFLNTEMSVYESYSRSIVDDGDLNISNQLFFKDDFRVVTESGYFYTHHSYGNAILSTPFFLYGRLVGNISGLKKTDFQNGLRANNESLKPFNFLPNSIETFESFTMGVGIFILFLYSFFFLLKLFSNEIQNDGEKKKAFYLQNFFLLLSAPSLYYLFWGQSTPSLSVIFPLALLFYFSRKNCSTLDNFLVGLSFGLGVLIRIDFSLYGLLIILWWSRKNGGYREKVSQFLGLVAILLPFVVFENHRLGAVKVGYLETFYFNVINIWDFYFSPYMGVLFTHPIVIFLILGSLYLLIKNLRQKGFKNIDHEFLVVFIILLIKSLLLSLTYSHAGGVFGPRQLIVDILLLGIFFTKYTYNKKILSRIYIGFFSINFFMSMAYANPSISLSTIFDYSSTTLSVIKNFFIVSLDILMNLHLLVIPSNLVNSVVICILPMALIFLVKRYQKYFMKIFMIYVVFMNLFVVVSDVGSEREVLTVEKKSNFMDSHMYYENMGSMIERVIYLEVRKRFSEKKEFEKLVKKYFIGVKEELSLSDEEMFNYFPQIKFDRNEEILRKILNSN